MNRHRKYTVAPAMHLPDWQMPFCRWRNLRFTIPTWYWKIFCLGGGREDGKAAGYKKMCSYMALPPQNVLGCWGAKHEEKEHGWAWQTKPRSLFSEPTMYLKLSKNSMNVPYFLTKKDGEFPIWNKVAHILVNYLLNVSVKWKKE